MHRPTNSTATILTSLTSTLVSDIKCLASVHQSEKTNPSIESLVNSLITAKKGIIKMLPPTSDGLDQVPVTANENAVSGYSENLIDLVENTSQLLSKLNDVEGQQQSAVQKVLDGNTIPNELQDSLSDVVAVYQQITNQLDRSTKTQQVSRLQIEFK